MYLMPFGQTSKSYTAEPEEDDAANLEFKKWIDKLHERGEYHRKLKTEIDENKE